MILVSQQKLRLVKTLLNKLLYQGSWSGAVAQYHHYAPLAHCSLFPSPTTLPEMCGPILYATVCCFSPSLLLFTQSSLTPPAAPSFSPSKAWTGIMLGLLLSGSSLSYVLMHSLLGVWQMQQKVVKEVRSVIHLDTMEAGPEYCVKAQTYVEAINRSSSFSKTQCVKAQGNNRTSFLFPCCSHGQGYPSSSPFCFHPVSPVCLANVLPICSLGEVKKEGSGVQPPTLSPPFLEHVDKGSPQDGWEEQPQRVRADCIEWFVLSLSEKFCCFHYF